MMPDWLDLCCGTWGNFGDTAGRDTLLSPFSSGRDVGMWFGVSA